MFQCDSCSMSFSTLRQLNGHYVTHGGGKSKHPLFEECIRLRINERKSISEIANITKLSKGTLYPWLKPYPLSDNERLQRYQTNQKKNSIEKKTRGEPSKFYLATNCGKHFTREDKARISETATLYRLAIYQFGAFKSAFEKATEDWIVKKESSSKVAILQVKWASTHNCKNGLPYANINKSNGRNKRRKYHNYEVDFFILYDFFTDTCYVFANNEVKNVCHLSIREDAAERWDKVSNFFSKNA